jgi:hypothetical protein
VRTLAQVEEHLEAYVAGRAGAVAA